MTELACAANHAPHDDVLEDSLLTSWARDRVLNHDGVGAGATPEQEEAFNRARMLYHGTQDWPEDERNAYAAKRARELRYTDMLAELDEELIS